MILKPKTWIWWLTWPFAHPTSGTFTTICETIFYPRGSYGWMMPTPDVEKHEAIHAFQQERISFLIFALLYVLFLPLFFNPFRYRWEYEAYRKGSGYSHETTVKILASVVYGWLPYWLHAWCVASIRKEMK